jgi:glycosyltransferase involved in cell wall biosynthesis
LRDAEEAGGLSLRDPSPVSFAGANGAGRTRTWTLNGDFITLKPTGVARYAWETVWAMDALIAEGHPAAAGLSLEIVAPRPPAAGAPRHIPLRIVPEFNRPRLPQVWSQIQLPRHVKGGLISLCNLGPVAVKRQIVCIHDLHTKLMPESYGRAFRLVHDVILPFVGRRAATVTTVSRFAADTLAAHGVAPRERVVVTYNGHEHALRWQPERGTIPIGPRPFVVTLGRDLPYKNTKLVFRIADALNALGLDLYITGAFDAAAVAGDAGIAPNVRLLGRVSDDDLAQLLREARCFLFPTRMEGFGLPAVEAMAWGCPLVVSPVASLPEVCGDAALYADPEDDGAWIEAIRRIVTEPGLGERMARDGRAQVARFSWRTIAEQYLMLMEKADARR